ncbi:MAG: SAM-dependent methyltransferase [Rhodobacteraceae bacterium]|nr:SAM-dependent methyltransferase [Paracoccaceae bacterium]
MSLAQRLISDIALTGPIRLSDFMARALLDPQDGYYTNRQAIGAFGDFITAPEISQMFGELIGLCLAQCWMDQGAPDRFTLAELGPGRGTLMADILRATRGVPGFASAAEVTLVEASPAMRAVQAETLASHEVQWLEDTHALPEQPLFLVANEFFDALPIDQYERANEGWRARHVGQSDGVLAFGLGPAQPQPVLAHRMEDTSGGDVVEHCPQLGPIVETLSSRVAAHGGAALIIDYGDWRSLGDTLQALAGHAAADPLAQPGHADLTAHVDFEAIARAATPVKATRLCPQGVFLERLGITARAQALAAKMQGDMLEQHIAAHRRLTHPDEMGTLFKVMGLIPKTAAPPPGLEL